MFHMMPLVQQQLLFKGLKPRQAGRRALMAQQPWHWICVHDARTVRPGGEALPQSFSSTYRGNTPMKHLHFKSLKRKMQNLFLIIPQEKVNL